MKNIIIIGGGISGLCSAYYLIKEGHKVKIIDQGTMSTGASWVNAGYLVPSHFIPLAEPGIITQGMKWMLNNKSPFYIKPRIDFEFFKWAWEFKKSSIKTKVEKAIPVILEANLKSKALYEEILASQDFDFHYEKKGLLMAYQTSKGKAHELIIADKALKLGLEAELLSPDALKKIQPVFSNQVLGAVHYKCDAHITPDQFMGNLKNWLKVQGVEYLLNQKVEGFRTKATKIISVKTQNGEFEADEFLLATGSWTTELAKSLGLNIPIQGGKGYSLKTTRPLNISIPAILSEAKIAVTPMDGFTRFSGTMEFSGNNTIIRKNRIEALTGKISEYYDDLELNEMEKTSATSGLRPVSPDGLPFIGKTAKYANLNIAAGHAMMGWSMGPLTGKLMSELISGKPTSVDLKPFSLERFQ